MDRLIPLSALEHPTYGVLAVDARGEVRFCNRAAACLLRTDPDCARTPTCWRLARLRTPEGEPFCAADCPVQRQARRGALASTHRVTPASRSGAARALELVTFLVPPPQGGRFPVLHLLRPIPGRKLSAGTIPPSSDTATSAEPIPEIRTEPLSSREEEVLHLLAAGLRDQAIAGSLSISPITVRNHVQRIMNKLGVHRRLEAVIAFLQQHH